MSKKKIVASEEEIKKLYEPDYFYEHGDNPAFKKFMEICSENLREGKLPDYRTYVVHQYKRFFFARNWEDFLHNDLKCFSFPRAAVAFTAMTWIFGLSMRYTRSYLPLGEHGIKHIRQTQFYHLFGPVGVGLILLYPAFTGYLWYKTTVFTAKKFYRNVLLGDRNWSYEMEKNRREGGEYFFKDTPLATEDDFPDLARGEMAKKKINEPTWLKK